MFVVMFLFFGAFFIISNQNLSVAEDGNFLNFIKLYYNWFAKIFDNVKGISGNVVDSDWLP